MTTNECTAGIGPLLFMVSLFFVSAASQTLAMGPTEPGSEASGNVDGVLNFTLGNLGPGESAARSVVFLFADSPEKAREMLAAAKADTTPSESVQSPPGEMNGNEQTWIDNGTTDFCLMAPCFFRWDIHKRQSLRCDNGGQLSQTTFYVHYEDKDGKYRAGIPHYENEIVPENLRVEQWVKKLGEREITGTLVSGDGKVRVRLNAILPGNGPYVRLVYRIENISSSKLDNVSLGVYANIEANHDETNDFATLDSESAGLMVIDIPSRRTVIMAGIEPPVSGHVGTWNSFDILQNAKGIAREQWKTFAGFSPEMEEKVFLENALAQGYYLPGTFNNAQTPETRGYSREESAKILNEDWERQAMGKPWGDRAIEEIAWTRDLAERIGKPALSKELLELDGAERRLLENSIRGLDPEIARRSYREIREIKRKITFKNPVVDFSGVLFIDQPYQTHREGNHESIHRMGVSATPGGRLLVLDGLGPDAALRELAPRNTSENCEQLLGGLGSFWRPDLSFDAGKVVFCYKPVNEKSFKLYEINLDGTGLKRLTESDYDDIDPIYLPDGKIMFTTTRGNSHVRCGPFIYSYILARCNPDGSDLYLLSYNGEPDFVPSLLNDGRVIYSRWEYSDKPLWRVQSLWTTNQDGTNTAGFWGNQSVWPDHVSQPRAIPGSERIMFVGVGHHDWWSGSIGMIDPRKGGNYPLGLTKVTADRPWPECSQPPLDPHESPKYHAAGAFTGYSSPYPLSEKDFLVSARSAEDGKFRLYLMDTDGNRELIYEGTYNIWNAFPIKPRAVPPLQSDRVAWPGTGAERKKQEGGTFFNPDIYQGLNGIERGEVRSLRVMQLDYKTYSTWKKTFRNSGPAVSIVQEEGVKRVLSLVPVETDGSVFFEAPSGVSLYFQLLDEQGRCLHTMRSFSGLMPGENRGCVGCHEQQHSTISPGSGSLAMQRGPTPLTPPSWGTESIGYERFVQPVLDKYCAECHSKDGSEGKKSLDLTLRPGHHIFKEPYLTLIGPAGWGNPVPDRGQAGYGIADVIPVETMDPSMNDPKALVTLMPKKYLSLNSRLVDYCASGKHYDVKVDNESLQKIMVWVDACGPFCGEEEIRAMDDPDFNGIELLPIRPRVKTAPVIMRP